MIYLNLFQALDLRLRDDFFLSIGLSYLSVGPLYSIPYVYFTSCYKPSSPVCSSNFNVTIFIWQILFARVTIVIRKLKLSYVTKLKAGSRIGYVFHDHAQCVICFFVTCRFNRVFCVWKFLIATLSLWVQCLGSFTLLTLSLGTPAFYRVVLPQNIFKKVCLDRLCFLIR